MVAVLAAAMLALGSTGHARIGRLGKRLAGSQTRVDRRSRPRLGQRLRALKARLPSLRRRSSTRRPAPVKAHLDTALHTLGQHLHETHKTDKPTLRQRCTKRLQRLGHCVMEGARKLKQVKPRAVMKKTGAALKQGVKWSREHPGKALGLGLGTAAMFATVFCVAPAVSAGVAGCLTPVLGQTGATIAGTAAGGALACGSRSLLVHSTPMLLKIDPFNARQLATDTAMSATFGFFGFAQAAFLKTLTGGMGSWLALLAANYVGLVGYELGKDYLQNRIRNRVANDPKSFKEIWKSSLIMETASNLHRCIPGLGLETHFGAKILGDLGGTIWWDRIVNKRNQPHKGQGPGPGRGQGPDNGHVHDALTE
jgi:hypothetical protein